jgi:hypothetical protein
VEKIARKRNKSAYDDDVSNGAVGADGMELNGRFFLRRASWGDIGVPDKERLPGGRYSLNTSALLEKSGNRFGNRVECQLVERLKIILLFRSASGFNSNRGKWSKSIILTNSMRFVKNFFCGDCVAHHKILWPA